MRPTTPHKQPDTPLQVFHFTLATKAQEGEQRQKFGVNVSFIQEIAQVKRASFSSLPMANAPFAGVVRIHDKTVVLVDLKHVLGYGSADIAEELVLLVVNYRGKQVGFPIAETGDIVNSTWGDMKALNISIPGAGGCMEGLLEDPEGGAAITVLAIEELLDCLGLAEQRLAA